MNFNTYTNAVLIAELNYYDAEMFHWQTRSNQSKGMHKKYCENKLSTFKILYEAAKKEAQKRNLL